jgi:hypothetical protein
MKDSLSLFFFLVWWHCGFMLARQALYHLSHSTSSVCVCVCVCVCVIFRIRVLWPICQGWLWTMILLISASRVARLQVWATSAQLTRFSYWSWRHGLGGGVPVEAQGPEFKPQHCQETLLKSTLLFNFLMLAKNSYLLEIFIASWLLAKIKYKK